MRLVSSLKTSLTSCCAESLKKEDGSTVLAFGSYELCEELGERKGELILASWKSGDLELDILSKDSGIPGVFDMKWSCDGYMDWLGIASADGRCYIRRGAGVDPQWISTEVSNECSEFFCLSLDWNCRAARTLQDSKIAVSRSDGKASVLTVGQTEIILESEWQAHKYDSGDGAEVWITAFDPHNPSVLATGADDGRLKFWDYRSGFATPTYCNKRSHEAGVCSIQYSCQRRNTFATGSYDNCVRIWDSRKLSSPVQPDIFVNGGVWRVKWHPKIPELILVAGMRAGFIVLDVDKMDNERVVSVYKNGLDKEEPWEALAYGVDWFTEANGNNDFIISASFYDKTLRILDPQLVSRSVS